MDAVGASNALGVIKVTMPSKVIALHCNEYNGLYSTPFARRVVDEETDTQGLLVPGTSVLLSKCSKPTKRSRKGKTIDRFWIFIFIEEEGFYPTTGHKRRRFCRKEEEESSDELEEEPTVGTKRPRKKSGSPIKKKKATEHPRTYDASSILKDKLKSLGQFQLPVSSLVPPRYQVPGEEDEATRDLDNLHERVIQSSLRLS